MVVDKAQLISKWEQVKRNAIVRLKSFAKVFILLSRTPAHNK